MKRIASDIIILHVYQKTQSYEVQFLRYGVKQNLLSFWAIFCPMMYAYSDVECDRHNCHFRSFFAHLPHYWPPKLKFGKKSKKTLILSFYTCVTLIQIIQCMLPEIWSATDRFFLSNWAIFCPFTPLTVQKIKIWKNKRKTCLEI